MKKKLVYDSLAAGVITLLGIVLLMFPEGIFEDMNSILFIVMATYTAVKLLQYFLTRVPKDRDYENLLTAIACVLAATSALVFNFQDSAMVLAFTIIGWVFIVGIVKLVKVDYLMDRKNNMWYIKMIDFTLFVLIGVLTTVNLYYSTIVQTLILGFYLVLNGGLELIYPVVSHLLEKNQVLEKAVKK